MFILAIISIVGNSAPTSLANIQDQFDRLSCPMPSQTGLWNSSGVIQYTGATYNYPNVGNMTLTLTCTEIHTTNGVDYYYGAPGVAIGVFFFIGDYVSELFANKVAAVFTLIAYVLSPANFNFLGYGIEDITGIVLMFVITLYVFSYIAIGIFLYKVISPFAGMV